MITDLTTASWVFRGRQVAPNQGMWEVFTQDPNSQKIGTIMWSDDWNVYLFSSTSVFSADADPLQDIVDFLKARTLERTA